LELDFESGVFVENEVARHERTGVVQVDDLAERLGAVRNEPGLHDVRYRYAALSTAFGHAFS